MTGGAYVIVALAFGLVTAIIGRSKGSSFFIWFIVGTVLPVLGLISVFLYRVERLEPERRCPRCGHVHKLHVQVCRYCGEDLYLPDPSEVRQPQP
jgi:UDP-N-acetylmuramyl pentapeptide phosphotransferase/UDP-N-acetylglucosamine-1-phosphate transferase